MLTVFGWIDGITASGVVIFGFIFGFFFLYKARKSSAKILTILGIVNILAGLMYLGVFTDFIVVLATETNLDNTYGLVGILSYIWFAPVMVLALYIGAELLLPKKKWYLMTIIIIICIVFVILFFMDPMGTFNFPPLVPGELIDYNVNLFEPAGIIMAILLLAVLIVLGFGFLIKSFQSSGVLRMKFLFLSLGAICFCIFGLLEGLTAPGDILMVIIVRIGYLISFWLMYYGLKD